MSSGSIISSFLLPCRKDPKCRSEIPEYLRIIAKPVVDAILAGKPLSDEDLLKRILDCSKLIAVVKKNLWDAKLKVFFVPGD